ncbi:unnamed protein product [Didymodactylos carnosus]|uniref:Heme haloperoxidase family profile domain-containing protein n=1 Tax=Didymodactylos carnosus TaxID=1234261 RepID=A0A814T0Y6_9BILA|nr:unnamed protein product [Didymodactylos carnosus]CAF1225913.1 unnamed protein product [Didymodactylos carnosus]CAF3917921.1 unnamed protein product [Didymodactylos carnosus]CAF4034005.1 unnamed protein product [Didymodactylos carnosus]
MGNLKSTGAFSDESKYKYEAPGPNDSRSSCPALNTLANHGYLPRDGNNITPEVLQRAAQEKIGLSWLTAKIIIRQAYKTVGKNGVLSLSDLSYHAPESMEHDGSLSRVDAALSNNQQGKFNQERFNKLVSFSKDGEFLTTEDVAAARLYFKADSQANNPQYLWNNDAEAAIWTEASILLHILVKRGRISIEDAKLFFEEETFPHGWQKYPSFGVLELRSATKALKNAARELEERQ